jgi:hypothetical protein
MVQYILKYNNTYKCYNISKQFLHQLQAMFICYPTIYDMTMLALVSCVNILIEWKYTNGIDDLYACQ